ncbi:MAG: ferrous iron transport protein A [Peptococcaceae bacterium]|jgi:ferrous iron transport protein A|nr:ferrous iron transport protein A [Peptococcaceae bacterium]
MATLSSLKAGTQATVASLSIEGLLRRRILDLGIIPGANIRCIGPAPSGDPIAYEIRGSVIALRLEDAGKITVQLI